MKIFDLHSHWGTKRGYPLRTEAELAQQKKVWSSEPRYHTEDEMADYFRLKPVDQVKAGLAGLLADAEIVPVDVEG